MLVAPGDSEGLPLAAENQGLNMRQHRDLVAVVIAACHLHAAALELRSIWPSLFDVFWNK